MSATVFLHIGEPKTGTTGFQETVWRHRGELARAGVELAGLSPTDHFRAMQDLRGIPAEADNPGGSWDGEWDILAAQASSGERTVLISQESIAAAGAAAVERAVRSLGDAEVHVVLTVRDFASLLPAEWQETVKHRNTRSWPEWLAHVRAEEPGPGTRPAWGFWRVHDTPEVLRVWSRFVPAHRIHVVTMPPRTSAPDLLWRRLAGLLGIDDLGIDGAGGRRNTSLGLAETEYLRALSPLLVDRVPNWFYAAAVKNTLAHEALAARPTTLRPTLPPAQFAWAVQRAEATIEYLRSSSHDVLGDLDELRPAGSGAAHDEAGESGTAPAGERLDVAVHALSALIERQHAQTRRAASAGPGAGLTDRALQALRSSPRATRAIRELSTHRGAGWSRAVAWRMNEAARRRAERPAAGRGR